MIDRLGIGISGCRHYGLRPKALRLRGLAAQAAGATRLGRGVAVALRLDWRVVELQLVHAQFLGRAQCEAGLFHQRALVGDMHRVRRDADAGCDAELALPLQQHRRTDGVEQLARDRFGLLRGRQLVCQHGELVANEARHHVAGTQLLLHARSELAQCVPDLAAQAVVHALETVHVEQQDREATFVALDQLHRLRHQLAQRRPVRQAGERSSCVDRYWMRCAACLCSVMSRAVPR
jgi:hypothetical protein